MKANQGCAMTYTSGVGGKVTILRVSMIRRVPPIAATLAFILATALPGASQANPALERFFRENIGLTASQVSTIRSGQPVTKALPSREPAEVFLFGAVFIHAAPESYVKFAHDFDRLRRLPNYLALGVFSNPPQMSDLKGFSFEKDDIESLKNCKPGDCLIHLPTSSIKEPQL